MTSPAPLAAATLLSAALLAAAPAQAQTSPVQPGLWQFKVTLKSRSGQIEAAIAQAQAQLAQLPPEQRRKVEQMMADRGLGIDGGATLVNVCIGKEDAERGALPMNLHKDECTQTWGSRGATATLGFSCKTDPPSSGTGEYTVLSPSSVRAKAVVDTTVNGKPERLDTAQEGTWQAADCGNLKP